MKNKKNKIWTKIAYSIITLFLLIALTIFALEKTSHYTVSKSINQEAPVITKKTITINAPLTVVWGLFSDINNWDKWQKEIVDPKINGQFKEGATFDWKSNGLTIHSTLQTVEIKKKVSWSGPAFGAFAIHTWHFTETNGQTVIRVEESMEGWLVTLFDSIFQSKLDTSIDHWLMYLKIASEK